MRVDGQGKSHGVGGGRGSLSRGGRLAHEQVVLQLRLQQAQPLAQLGHHQLQGSRAVWMRGLLWRLLLLQLLKWRLRRKELRLLLLLRRTRNREVAARHDVVSLLQRSGRGCHRCRRQRRDGDKLLLLLLRLQRRERLHLLRRRWGHRRRGRRGDWFRRGGHRDVCLRREARDGCAHVVAPLGDRVHVAIARVDRAVALGAALRAPMRCQLVAAHVAHRWSGRGSRNGRNWSR